MERKEERIKKIKIDYDWGLKNTRVEDECGKVVLGSVMEWENDST